VVRRREAADESLREPTIEVIRTHPSYGYRRIRPDLEEAVGEVVNDKRLRRLLGKWELGLHRTISRPEPSPIRRTLKQARGHLNLVEDRDPEPLQVLSTDFTELRYAGGDRKAWLIGFIDLDSAWMPGWATGPSANRELALEAWSRTRTAFSQLGRDVATTFVHSDPDPVFTSYDWLRTLLLDSGARVSFSENGAKDNPWIESFWARFKHENHSLFLEAATLAELCRLVDQQMRYYNRERRHSAVGNQPPLAYLESEGIAA
jgi:transposase InsO family protein